MIFLIFLASVVATEWIVRRQPASPQGNSGNPSTGIARDAAGAAADIASLARALATESCTAETMQTTTSKRVPS